MTVSTHVEGPRLAPLRNSGHVEEASHRVDKTAKNELPFVRLHHLGGITIEISPIEGAYKLKAR